MSQSNSTSGGVGLSGLLLVAFIVLKLCKVIDWSWWWVLSPAWLPAVILLGIAGIAGLVWLAVTGIQKWRKA